MKQNKILLRLRDQCVPTVETIVLDFATNVFVWCLFVFETCVIGVDRGERTERVATGPRAVEHGGRTVDAPVAKL